MGKKYKCLLREIRLKEYMEDNKSRFARRLNTEVHTYAKWENEESTPTLLKALEVAKLLNKHIEDIWQLIE